VMSVLYLETGGLVMSFVSRNRRFRTLYVVSGNRCVLYPETGGLGHCVLYPETDVCCIWKQEV
jgi:hypothetical protein